MKRQLPLALVFTLGIIYFFVPFISAPFAQNVLYTELYVNWIKIIGVFAIIMSIASLWRRNIVKIQRKHGDYIYSYIEIIGMVVIGLLAILPNSLHIGNVNIGGIGDSSVYNWVFSNMQIPMQATMFSMLAFYIASAAYRSFRARNVEATLLLITAAIVMIGRVPAGENIYQLFLKANAHFIPNFHWAGIFNFQGMTQWILDIPNTATKRAILFGVSMGMVATSLKIIFGIEKSWLGGSE
ncbi:hypothetical protein J7L48_08770 [bacterium]|nr:hypothetical protein [bacterium]